MKPIYVTHHDLPDFDDFVERLKPLWESRSLTNMGTYHQIFEEKLKDFLKVQNLHVVSNGHLGLEVALEALHLSGEVITTPFTFSSTTHALVRHQITPVFGDIRESDYTLDPDKIEALITDKTTAIMPVHVFGNPCDVDKIQEIADRHGLKVIYDAAPVFGSTYKGKSLCDYGDISVMSFHATKVFHTVEGGALVLNNPEIAEHAKYIRNFGICNETSVRYVGLNAKLNEIQSIMGICNLDLYQEQREKRKLVFERYQEQLRQVSGIRLMELKEDLESNYAYFPIWIDEKIFGEDRNQVYTRLREHQIFPRKYYYPLVPDYECYRGRFSWSQCDVPVAKKIAEGILVLPFYSELSMMDVDRICELIKNKS